MLRGSKSLSCSGSPSGDRPVDGNLIAALGTPLPARRTPKLCNKSLRPTPPMKSSKVRTFFAKSYAFCFELFYIVYFRLSKCDKAASSVSTQKSSNERPEIVKDSSVTE